MSGKTNVRLPDGRTVSVPTDNPQAAAAAARRHWEATKPKDPNRSILGRAVDGYKSWVDNTATPFVENAVDNFLPNWGDEIRGTGRAVSAAVRGKPVAPAFREGQRSFKADQKRFAKAHPTARNVSSGVGVLAGMALPAGGALKGATMAQKVRQGAKVGALYGLAAGAGEGEGLDLERRSTNAAVSGATGAVGGAVMSPLIRGGQLAGQQARMRIPGVDAAASGLAKFPQAALRRMNPGRAPVPTAAEEQGNRMVAARMHRGNISHGPTAPIGPAATPEAVGRELERRNLMGVPAMVADTTDPLRRMTGWASRGTGPGQDMVREALARRKATEGNRVRQHVQDTFPTTADPVQFVADRQRQAREAAAPLYEQAYAQPMQVTKDITGITQTPAFREALPQARRNIQNQIDPTTGLPKDPSAMGLRWFDGEPGSLAPNLSYAPAPGGGYVAADRTLSTEGFDQVARAMDGNIPRHPITGRPVLDSNTVHINNRTRDLRQRLAEQNEPYRQAVEGYGDDMTQIRAFDQGQDVGKLTGPEINAHRGALPDPAHETWATGAGTAMADEASRHGASVPNADTANHIRKMLGDDAKQAAISEMSGNTGGVRNLQERLEMEHQGNLTWKGTYGNSASTDRSQIDSDLGGDAGVPTSWAAISGRLLNYVASKAAPQFQNDVKERIAKIMTASNAQSVEEVMAAIGQQAQRDRSFANLLHKAGVGGSAAYGMNVKPISPVAAEEYNDGY